MVIICKNQALKLESATGISQLSVEECDYAARLREVENSLLRQALGGQLPQPTQRLQHYLDGGGKRTEAFQPLYYPASHSQLA